MAKSLDLTGKKFNYLTPLYKTDKKDSARGNYWWCKCDCGEEKEISTNAIVKGSTISCGCFRKRNNTKHGKSGTRLHNIWMGARNRCFSEKSKDFKLYGGRGISMCEEWEDFMNFYNWSMYNGYTDLLTLDREDNDGNYEPSNCRWITMREQGNNRTSNNNIEIGGIIKNVSQWAKELGISKETVIKRFKNN